MVRWACWYTLSSTDPNNICQIWKITWYVLWCEMCVHLYNCKFDGLISLVSLNFKTLWKMFTQRGEYVGSAQLLPFSVSNNYGSISCQWYYSTPRFSCFREIMGLLTPGMLPLTSAMTLDHQCLLSWLWPAQTSGI